MQRGSESATWPPPEARKGAQPDEGTGRHRKAAIRLLRRAPRAPTARSSAGRPRRYGPAVAAAVEVLWQATGHIGPQRLQPFVPVLLDQLTHESALRLAPEVDAALDRLWTLAAPDPHRQAPTEITPPSSKSAPEGSETTPPVTLNYELMSQRG